MLSSEPPTILIVEDQPMQRGLLTEILTEAGYAVKEAWNGDDAIVAITGLRALGRRLDLILLDVRLPYRNGIEVLQYLAAQRIYVPVVAMSAHADLLDAAKEEGAQATIVKPYDVDEVLQAVARYCPLP